MKRNEWIILAAALSGILSSCGPSGLNSDNYWNGAEQEAKWAKSAFPGAWTSGTDEGEKAGKEAIPSPKLKKDNRKFRIAVVISGDYWEFQENLKGLIAGFSNIGWAKNVSPPASLRNSAQLIAWLSRQDYSDYIEFDPALFYDLKWGDNVDAAKRELLDKRPDADLIMAYGGVAAKFFYKNDNYPIPVLAEAITDPIAAGVTASADDSGKDFFSCKMDTEQFRRQISLFHDIAKFKKLGIVYGNDEYGMIYGAVRDVEAAAKEMGFEIVRNTKVKEEMADDTVDLYLAALKDVASRSDAVYLGASTAVTEYDSMDRIVEILDDAKVPSFALEGSIRVKNGIMLSMASSGTIRSGIYNATKAVKAFNGTMPRKLGQRFESIASVAVNLATADKIGFRVPVDFIINSDEIYLSRDGSAPVAAKRSRKTGSELSDFAKDSIRSGESMEPRKKPDGRPYRIAVVVSGSYWEFDQHFKGILNGLVSEKWAKSGVVGEKAVFAVKQQLLKLSGFSEYVEFPLEYYVDLEWGENLSAAERLFGGKNPDIDLIIAFGGVAGKYFAKFKEYPVPVLMEGITDPVGSGVIYSTDDSGRDFATCRVDPEQYLRQVQLFHDFIGFKRLGIIYGDDDYGRLYGAVHDVELAARKNGFSLVRNTKVKEKLSSDTVKLYLAALRDLCGKVDAVYLGASTALTEYDITRQVSDILVEAGIPSFALEGEIRVRDGIMLGVSSLESEKFGLYNAKKIISIFSGQSPRSLPQRMEGVPSIVLNLATARKIGMDIPLSVLSSVDQIYY
jgi:ABC-type uncharacterized transport system substrate-binding protein